MLNTSFITTVVLFLSVFEYFKYSYLVECLFYGLNVGNLNLNTFLHFILLYIYYTQFSLQFFKFGIALNFCILKYYTLTFVEIQPVFSSTRNPLNVIQECRDISHLNSKKVN